MRPRTVKVVRPSFLPRRHSWEVRRRATRYAPARARRTPCARRFRPRRLPARAAAGSRARVAQGARPARASVAQPEAGEAAEHVAGRNCAVRITLPRCDFELLIALAGKRRAPIPGTLPTTTRATEPVALNRPSRPVRPSMAFDHSAVSASAERAT